MKHALVHSKSPRQDTSGSLRRPLPGPKGIALTPPAYGIDFVDHQRVTDEEASSQPQSLTNQQMPEPGRRLAHPTTLLQRASATPGPLRRTELLQLQRTMGNRAVSRLLRAQPKLTVGLANDHYEQEADRIAEQVSSILAAPTNTPGQPQISEVRGKVQRRLVPQQSTETDTVATPHLEAAIQQARNGGQQLPGTLRASMERAFGADFSGVKIHRGAQPEALSRSLHARAFTSGQDIFLGRGEDNFSSSAGKTLLAHELTHVVQQQGQDAIQCKLIERMCAQNMQRPFEVYQDREWIFRYELTRSLDEYFRYFVKPEYERNQKFHEMLAKEFVKSEYEKQQEEVQKIHEEFTTNRQELEKLNEQGGEGTQKNNGLVKSHLEKSIQALDALVEKLNLFSTDTVWVKPWITTIVYKQGVRTETARDMNLRVVQEAVEKIWGKVGVRIEYDSPAELRINLAKLPEEYMSNDEFTTEFNNAIRPAINQSIAVSEKQQKKGIQAVFVPINDIWGFTHYPGGKARFDAPVTVVATKNAGIGEAAAIGEERIPLTSFDDGGPRDVIFDTAHEIGHALGLEHAPPLQVQSLMHQALYHTIGNAEKMDKNKAEELKEKKAGTVGLHKRKGRIGENKGEIWTAMHGSDLTQEQVKTVLEFIKEKKYLTAWKK